MKNTGIVRRVDELGRIVLPKETRDLMGIEAGTTMGIFVDGDKIILSPYIKPVLRCKCCGSNEIEVDK